MVHSAKMVQSIQSHSSPAAHTGTAWSTIMPNRSYSTSMLWNKGNYVHIRMKFREMNEISFQMSHLIKQSHLNFVNFIDFCVDFINFCVDPLQNSPENDFVRYITREHSPRPEIHQNAQFDEIQNGQSRRKEHSHPNLSLIIHQMQDIFSNLKVAILKCTKYYLA